MSRLAAAFGFLTRIPVRTGSDPSSAIGWFPVVGAVVGAVSGTVFWAASQVTVPWMAASLAVAAAVAVTGAFHEDGLADTFDGVSSIRSTERQVEIMRDSRLGSFGVAALTLVLVSRVAGVAALAPTWRAVLVLAWLHAVAAAVVIVVMSVASPARVDGSGAEYLRRFSPTIPLAVAAFTVAGGWLLVGAVLVPAVAGALVPAGVVAWWASRRLGGVTGDVLGACQQLALVGGLAIVAA
ncbi:MAG: adenosylcobinamide-GDP ribazoletransferase [Acidimicrobiia bacterium]